MTRSISVSRFSFPFVDKACCEYIYMYSCTLSLSAAASLVGGGGRSFSDAELVRGLFVCLKGERPAHLEGRRVKPDHSYHFLTYTSCAPLFLSATLLLLPPRSSFSSSPFFSSSSVFIIFFFSFTADHGDGCAVLLAVSNRL